MAEYIVVVQSNEVVVVTKSFVVEAPNVDMAEAMVYNQEPTKPLHSTTKQVQLLDRFVAAVEPLKPEESENEPN